ncbi:MAG: recombination protein O N-terminal domain-containing protein [Gemmatimonadetes bacterium]|nr:recombination protein O N-terminal domain-containing protein [Gemmatimonadota bacterium]
MHPVATDALVLHAFDYRESSRIVRLATRDLGIVSVIARGARSTKSKMGSSLDLFTSGVAHLRVHPTRDLHTLAGFDGTRGRPELAASLARFRAASAVAELCLRFGKEDDGGLVHAAATRVLDEIGAAGESATGIAGIGEAGAAGDVAVASVALAGAWRLVAEIGFAPAVTHCALCHAPIPDDAPVTFIHRAGGALCADCARTSRGGRTLPPAARATLAAWLDGDAVGLESDADSRAHQRLLREFIEEHVGDGRPLRAFLAWEEGRHAPATAP